MNKMAIMMLCASFILPATGAEAAETGAGSELVVESVRTPKKKDIRKVVFSVSLHCQKCVEKINANIAFEKGVKGLEVSLDQLTVTIDYDASKTDETKLADALRRLGYQVKKIAPAQ